MASGDYPSDLFFFPSPYPHPHLCAQSRVAVAQLDTARTALQAKLKGTCFFFNMCLTH